MPDALTIPTDFMIKLRNHNGLSRARKMKFIDEFLKA
jgi:hypothetical protein